MSNTSVVSIKITVWWIIYCVTWAAFFIMVGVLWNVAPLLIGLVAAFPAGMTVLTGSHPLLDKIIDLAELNKRKNGEDSK